MAASERERSRRDFGRAVVAGAVGALGLGSATGGAVEPASVAGDSPLADFVRALDAERRGRLVLRSDDPRRGMVQNHWAIVPEPIAALSARQQELALTLIREVLTDEAFDRWTQQRDDDAGGWKHDHLAVFTEAGGVRPVEWVVTGRHLTLRGSASGSIASGPLFWGHTVTGPTSLGHEALTAAETLFALLDPTERQRAIVPAESGRPDDWGLPLDTLSTRGQGAARRLLTCLIKPYRSFTVPAVQVVLKDSESLKDVCWQAFGPVHASPVAWRLLGRGFRWSIHSEPHFHSWFESI